MKKVMVSMLVLLSGVCVMAKDKESAVPNVELSSVTFGEVVNGVEFDAKALAGKVVVIEEWGVNCPPCIASLPDMAKLAKSGEKKGLVVVGMEMQGSEKEAINKVLKGARVQYPVTKGGNVKIDSSGIPHVAVFNAEGKLAWHGHPADDEFKRAVKVALRTVKKE